MRQLQYLSPSSIDVYRQSPEQFYIQYLADMRPPRPPQTQPMAIGSAFDAYAKSHLARGIDFETLFAAQVEEQNRAWAKPNGQHVYKMYQRVGAKDSLKAELGTAARYESEIRGTIDGVPFLGRPDVHWDGTVFDWKVNGYLSKRTTSPAKGYVELFTVNGMMGPHKQAGLPLEEVDQKWATQLSIYAWLCGVPVGGKFVAAIDQIVCSPNMGELPSIRVAKHRTTIGADFQQATLRDAKDIWRRCQDQAGYFDKDSVLRCQTLEKLATDLSRPVGDRQRWFAEACRV